MPINQYRVITFLLQIWWVFCKKYIYNSTKLYTSNDLSGIYIEYIVLSITTLETWWQHLQRKTSITFDHSVVYTHFTCDKEVMFVAATDQVGHTHRLQPLTEQLQLHLPMPCSMAALLGRAGPFHSIPLQSIQFHHIKSKDKWSSSQSRNTIIECSFVLHAAR